MKLISLIVLILILVSSCSSPAIKNRSIASDQAIDRVFVFGATTQGNGYNWAATVSWLATKLEEVAQEAEVAKNNGEKVAIKLASFSGGSSGSGVAMLYDSFLNNQNIISSSSEALDSRLVSIEDVKRLSKALRFSSVSFDFHWFFSGSTVYRVLKRNILAVLDKISDVTPIPDYIGNGRRTLWLSQMNGQNVVTDFSKFVRFANDVQMDDINEKIVWGEAEFKKISPSDMKSAAGREIMNSITHFDSIPLATSTDSLPASDLKLLQKIAKAQTKAAKRVVNNIVAKPFKDIGKDFRLARYYNAKPNDGKANNPFKEVMSERMSKGTMTVSMGARYKDQEEMDLLTKKEGLPYKRLRPYLFMDEETAKELLSSSEYQRMIKSGESFVDRYVIAVVDQRWAGINPSVREPGLLGELAGDMGGENFRIRKIYDPRLDNSKNFKLGSIDSFPDKKLFIAGGFPFEEMTAIPTSFYYMNIVNKLKSQYKNVTAIYQMFGHPNNKISPETTFAGKSLKKVFNASKTKEEFKTSMSDWKGWISFWNDRIANDYLKKNGVKLVTTEFNWSTGLLPSALTGKSRILAFRAARAAQKTNFRNKDQRFFEVFPIKAKGKKKSKQCLDALIKTLK